jgi:predicted PurR-regulated permease PerM
MAIETAFYQRLFYKLMVLALIITFLVIAREILIPFTVAVFFTFLLLPVSQQLEKWGLGRAIAIIISIILAFAVFSAFLYFLYSQVISFTDDWPELKQNMQEKLDRIHKYIRDTFHVSKREQVKWLNMKMKETASSGDEIVLGIFSATGAFIANLALIPIYIFFLTFYRNKFKKFIELITEPERHEQILMLMRKISTVSQKYLKGIFLDVLILAVLNSAGFMYLGIKHAVLFGVLAAVLNIIPYVGVMIGSVLPILMALLTKDEIGYAFGALAVCVIVQFLDNNFITPYVVGSSVSINPLTAILALVASAMIWGLPGMVLSIPLTGMLKVVCDNILPLKPYGFLIGEEVNYREKDHLHKRIWRQIRQKKKR